MGGRWCRLWHHWFRMMLSEILGGISLQGTVKSMECEQGGRNRYERLRSTRSQWTEQEDRGRDQYREKSHRESETQQGSRPRSYRTLRWIQVRRDCPYPVSSQYGPYFFLCCDCIENRENRKSPIPHIGCWFFWYQGQAQERYRKNEEAEGG